MTLVLKQMVVLFLMMTTGYVANKCGIMTQQSEQLFSKLIVNITCPALIINSVTTSARLESTAALFVIFGAAAAYYVMLPFVCKGIVRVLRVPAEQTAEYESMLLYSNIGFMGKLIDVVGFSCQFTKYVRIRLANALNYFTR